MVQQGVFKIHNRSHSFKHRLLECSLFLRFKVIIVYLSLILCEGDNGFRGETEKADIQISPNPINGEPFSNPYFGTTSHSDMLNEYDFWSKRNAYRCAAMLRSSHVELCCTLIPLYLNSN